MSESNIIVYVTFNGVLTIVPTTYPCATTHHSSTYSQVE